ncbi:DMT family transporter [Planctomycetes bacterium CA13]
MHLLLPLLASILFVCGLIFIKRASEANVGPATIMFLTNMLAALFFSFLWLFGGSSQPTAMLWQPALVAGFYLMGLGLTFAAVERGDVSIATPIFGVKVIFVALMLTITRAEKLPASVWYAAFLAAAGIALIQWTGRGHRRRMVMTILLALGAAVSFATFDTLVQKWTPQWGFGRFVPLLFWIVAAVSIGLTPWVEWHRFKEPQVRRSVLPGALLIAMQAVCITSAVSFFGDAARVNVVYALRGLWGVVLAYAAARIWGGAEADHSRSVMIQRAVGAGLLTAAVVLAIVSR